jgi:hypothetical protein
MTYINEHEHGVLSTIARNLKRDGGSVVMIDDSDPIVTITHCFVLGGMVL